MFLDRLKRLNTDQLQLDDLVELAALCQVALTTYKQFEIPVPTFLEDGLEALSVDIRSRRIDAMKARLKEINSSRAVLRTREERRVELDAEEARIKQAISGANPNPAS